MVVKENTDILLFRYSKYDHYDFLSEHKKILERTGCVWILKAGRKTNEISILDILSQGGMLVLKSPKSEGGRYSFCTFDLYSTETPDSALCPSYYTEFIDSQYYETTYQWFRITKMLEMNDAQVNSLRVKKNGMKVSEIIQTTRTSVMFLYNDEDLVFEGKV